MKCSECESTRHVFCTVTPLVPIDPDSPEERLLQAILGRGETEDPDELATEVFTGDAR